METSLTHSHGLSHFGYVDFSLEMLVQPGYESRQIRPGSGLQREGSRELGLSARSHEMQNEIAGHLQSYFGAQIASYERQSEIDP